MLMETFDGEFGVEPILFAAAVITDVGVSHGRQFTGGVLRGMSGGAGAVNDDLSVLVRDQGCGKIFDLIGRQIFCGRDVGVVVSRFGKGLKQRESLTAVELGF